MGRAVALVVEHGFDPDGLGLARISWSAYVGNWPSRRVAWRAGFRVEGTIRGFAVQREGVRRDCWVGTLLRDDPREPNEPWPDDAPVDGAAVRPS
jgi:RimJ/RimL family protein N-acetyltransferase